jgi:hypothetical protein
MPSSVCHANTHAHTHIHTLPGHCAYKAFVQSIGNIRGVCILDGVGRNVRILACVGVNVPAAVRWIEFWQVSRELCMYVCVYVCVG